MRSVYLFAAVGTSVSAQQCSASTFQTGVDCYGGDLSNAPSADPAACCALCSNTTSCEHWTHDQYDAAGAHAPTCFLKTGCTKPQSNANAVSGAPGATPPSPTPAPGPTPASQPYARVDSFEGSTFFGGFEFYTGDDPTHGFVDFVDEATARAGGLIDDSGGGAVLMKADNTTKASAGGRRSIRLQSKATYTGGLFVTDLSHVPTGCGSWPAFWTCGPAWPTGGEIDIFEVVHNTAVCVPSSAVVC